MLPRFDKQHAMVPQWAQCRNLPPVYTRAGPKQDVEFQMTFKPFETQTWQVEAVAVVVAKLAAE